MQLLPFLLIFATSSIDANYGLVWMGKFGTKMIHWALNKRPEYDSPDMVRVGCYLLYCHFDDPNACVNDTFIDCECSEQCGRFSEVYTRDNLRPKTGSGAYLVWKKEKECIDECTLLLSKREGSDKICTSLCKFHFSYANREEYQKDVMEPFRVFMKGSQFRLLE